MSDIVPLLPEILLTLTMILVIVGEITYHGERVRLITATAVVGLAGAFLQTIVTYQYGPVQLFGRAISVDGFALFFKLFFMALAALSIVISTRTREIAADARAEYAALVLAATVGLCVAASSADLLLAFLALQFANIVCYFLAGYGKRSARSTEAGIKYMVFSAVAGGLLLYSLGILFASTRSLNMYEIHRVLTETPLPRESMVIIFVLAFLSFCFQIAAFPMYLWMPDVIEGAPTPASAMLSIAPRAAGFAVALRFFVTVFAQPGQAPGQWQVLGDFNWTQIVGLASGLSMITGALLAVRQSSAKRMVGCLVVAETGYLMMGVLVLDEVGVAALLYNLVIELFALVGIFYILSFLIDELKSDRLEDLKGMLGRAVPECICLILFLLSLVGLPPTPGFVGKFTLIGVAIRHQWLVLAFFGIAAMAISTIAVARLFFSLVGDFGKSSQGAQKGLMSLEVAPVYPNLQRKIFLAVVLVPMILVGVFAEFMLSWAGQSLGFILW